MLDTEKSFDEVRQWSDISKQDFIPVRNLRDKLKLKKTTKTKTRNIVRERGTFCATQETEKV